MEPVNSEGRRSAKFSIPILGLKPGQSIGLGSVLKRMTTMVGVRPCGGCQGRAAMLDRMVKIGRRGGKGGRC